MSVQRIVQIVGREIREIVPPALFFLVAFGLLIVTQALVLELHGIRYWDLGAAVIGALIIAKVVLIVDHFRFVDRYPDKPLIWNALWKTLIYNIGATLVRYLEELLPLLFKGEGLAAAHRTLFAELNWTHVVLVHMWLAVLLFVYCCFRELAREIGAGRVTRMFFHARKA
jgi:hypothetical protein